MINRQTLPHWIVGLTAVAMLFKPSVISIDAVAISGFVAFLAATLWAAYDARKIAYPGEPSEPAASPPQTGPGKSIMAVKPSMDVQQLAGLTDQELLICAMRDATMIVCAELGPGSSTADLRTRLLVVLDRTDVVAARSRLECHYGMRPLPASNDCAGV